MLRSTHKHIFYYSLLLMALFAACKQGDKAKSDRVVINPDFIDNGSSHEWETANMEATQDTFHVVQSKKWKIVADTLFIEELKREDVPTERRNLGFRTPVIFVQLGSAPLVEDPKSATPVAATPLAAYALNASKDRKPFYVNGEHYTGRIEGFLPLPDGSKKIVLSLFVYEGELVHKAIALSDKNKSYSADYAKVITITPNGMRKPIIYLYPTQKQRVDVKVELKGKLTHTYPAYSPATGWQVEADTDGKLTNLANGKTYYSLFWEGESDYQYDLSKGFVVKGSETADFLDESLEKLGLNRREAGEFITYWLPELEKNPYNLIHFSTEEYQTQAPLQVSPRPDTEIRIFMVYQPLQKPISIAPQTLAAPARKGFTLVEWGGKVQTREVQ